VYKIVGFIGFINKFPNYSYIYKFYLKSHYNAIAVTVKKVNKYKYKVFFK